MGKSEKKKKTFMQLPYIAFMNIFEFGSSWCHQMIYCKTLKLPFQKHKSNVPSVTLQEFNELI